MGMLGRPDECGRNNVAVLNQQASLHAGFYPVRLSTFRRSVFLLSPTSNQSSRRATKVKLTAAAFDIDGKVARVEYWLQAASDDYYNFRAICHDTRLCDFDGSSKNFPALWRKPPQGKIFIDGSCN